MIFNCPSCQAGHSVPVSMIPNGGMELSCRRCGTPFKVDIPTQAEEPAPALQAAEAPASPFERTEERPVTEDQPVTGDFEREPEATAVGMENPFDELVAEARSSALVPAFGSIHSDSTPSPDAEPPDETTHDLDVRRQPRAGEHERPTMPIDNEHVPLGPDEADVDPELDNTQRVDVDDDAPLNAPTVAAPAPTPSRVEAVEPSPDLYDRVEKGAYSPAEPKSKEPPAPAPLKAWNEPSQSVAGAMPKPALRRAADALNQAPLPVKVGLLVFPMALGVTLLLTASPPDRTATKVEIAVSPPDAATHALADVAPPSADKPPVASLDDPSAKDGYAYVQVDDARLRQKAQGRSPVVAKLAIGELVKVLPINEEWALVMVEPEGPAGFIPVRLLGGQQSIAKLADDLRFEGCAVAEGGPIDDCLSGAKQSQEACLAKCGPSGQASVRCVEACGVAFDRCAKDCAETQKAGEKKGKKKRPR